jgi:tetratricopeptide (TPR) repeat protein
MSGTFFLDISKQGIRAYALIRHIWILRKLLCGVLVAALLPALVVAQATQFDDLAAQAAQARDAGNLPQAVDLYRQATVLKPDWQEGWWYLGLLSYNGNQYSTATDAFTHLLQLAPRAVPAMALRGLCEYETADYDAALRDLDEAVAHGAANDPRNAQIIRYHLAQLLTRAGRFQDALAQYAFFVKEKVDSPDLDAAIGMAGMRDAALLNDAPAQDRVLYEAAGRAAYPMLADDSVESARRFNALITQYPSTRNLHYFYGFLLFPHAPEMAAVEFEHELTIAPDNTTARAMLAFSLMIMARYAEARSEAERVLAAEPDMEMAQIALGRSLIETGEPQRGEAMLKQVLVGDPNNLEAHLGLVSLYSHAGRKEDAQRERMVCLQLQK